MAFRAEVRRALAAPLGGSLSRRFGAATVTALVGNARGDERDVVALAELMDALVRVGVPRGRMLLLLAGERPGDADASGRARELRDTLGVPVITHDGEHGAHFRVGALANGVEIQLDDELREAEAIVVVGRFSGEIEAGVCGGPAALVPGLASAATRRALLAGQAGSQSGVAARIEAVLAAAREACTLAPVDFALLWSDDDPPRVLAGVGTEVFDRCVEQGWIAPHERRAP